MIRDHSSEPLTTIYWLTNYLNVFSSFRNKNITSCHFHEQSEVDKCWYHDTHIQYNTVYWNFIYENSSAFSRCWLQYNCKFGNNLHHIPSGGTLTVSIYGFFNVMLSISIYTLLLWLKGLRKFYWMLHACTVCCFRMQVRVNLNKISNT